MAPQAPAPRSYDSTRRRAQAQENRAKMLDAARDLFLTSGYAATTLAAIAEQAQVALPTLYAAFGSKRNLLAELLEERDGDAAVRVQLLGDDQLDQIKEVAEPAAKIDLYAAFASAHVERSYDLLIALRVAAGAEPEAAVLEQRRLEEDHRSLSALAAHLKTSGALRSGLSAAAAADTIWALSDVQLFSLLVRQRGWRVSKYRTWLAESLRASLLG